MRNPKKNEISGLKRFAQSGESDGFSSVFVVGITNSALCVARKEKVSNFDAVKAFWNWRMPFPAFISDEYKLIIHKTIFIMKNTMKWALLAFSVLPGSVFAQTVDRKKYPD